MVRGVDVRGGMVPPQVGAEMGVEVAGHRAVCPLAVVKREVVAVPREMERRKWSTFLISLKVGEMLVGSVEYRCLLVELLNLF